MQPVLKVMLIDDEIMALNHLKQLIPWEELGFSLVAAETNPRRALEFYGKLSPHILFVDIKMPLMNGLELSREILKLSRPVKIIILTSYKDFQYAREAVELGISSFLIKHELTAESLTGELKKIREEYREESRNVTLIRQRLIRSLLEGNNLFEGAETRIPPSLLPCSPDRIGILFCRIDRPFPFEGLGGTPETTGIQWGHAEPDDSGVDSDLILSGSEEALFLFYFRKPVSESLAGEIVEKNFRHIESNVGRLYGKRVIGTVTVCPHSLKALNGLLMKFRCILENRVFYDRETLILPEPASVPGNSEQRKSRFLSALESVESGLNGDSSEAVSFALDGLFRLLEEKPRSFRNVRWCCDRLFEMLEQYLETRLLPGFGGADIDPELDSLLSEMYTLRDLRKGFGEALCCALRKAGETFLEGYSPKVRQALEFIHNHYSRDFSVDDVADSMGISSVYLRKLFKQETGQTILNYLTGLRISKAENLLQTGEYRVFEVASIVGYNTSQYFSKVYKKITGRNPVENL